ncbi:MAG: hypothetical protein LQ352_006579 [Teloschistes flavicans]|nr:MAG: hypothetical protein LQ352_006579 [Teloschistes flavicans]
MSPVKSVQGGNVFDGSGKSTPRALVTESVETRTLGSSQHIESFMKNFAQYTQSVIDTTLIQGRYEAIARDEQRQTKELGRWSKYHSSFVAIGEDQSRILKATVKEKDELEQRLSHAKESGEKAMRTIATTILPTGCSSDIPFARDVTATESHSDEISSIKNSIKSLRSSDVDLKSKYHIVKEEQDRSRKDISDLWSDSIRKNRYHDFKDDVERKLGDHSHRIKTLVDKAEETKQDRPGPSQSQESNLSKSLNAKLQNLKRDFSKLEVDTKQSKHHISLLQKFKVETESTASGMKESIARTTDADASIRNDIFIQKGSLAKVERELEILNQQLQMQASARTKTEGNREVDVLQTKDVRYTCERFQATTDTFPQAVQSLEKRVTANEQLHTAQEALVARLNTIEQLCKQFPLDGSGSANVPTKDPKPRSPTESYVPQLEERMTKMEAELQAIREDIDRRDQQTDTRYETILQEIEYFQDGLMKLKSDRKLDAARQKEQNDQLTAANHSSSLSVESSTAELETIKKSIAPLQSGQDSNTQLLHQLQSELQAVRNQLVAEQSGHSNSIEQVKEEVRYLKKAIELFQSLPSDMDTQQQGLSKLQQALAEFQTQVATDSIPSPRGDSPKDEVNPKLEALESDYRHHKGQVTDRVNAFEEFLTVQQDRWNNLTTEPMVRAVLHIVQQMLPLPYIQTELRTFQSKLGQVEAYLTGLTSNLNKKDGEVDSKIRDATAISKAVEERLTESLASSKDDITAKFSEHIKLAAAGFQSQLDTFKQTSEMTIQDFQARLFESETKLAKLEVLPGNLNQLQTELSALKHALTAFEDYKAMTSTEKQQMESAIQTLQTLTSRSQDAHASLQVQLDGVQKDVSEARQELTKVPNQSNLEKMREDLREELGKDFYPVYEHTRERVDKLEAIVPGLTKSVESCTANVGSLGKKTESLDRSLEEMWALVKEEIVNLTNKVHSNEHVAPPGAGAGSDDPEIEETQDQFVDAEESPESQAWEAPEKATSGAQSRRPTPLGGWDRGGARPVAGRKARSDTKKRARNSQSNDDSDHTTEGSLSSPPIRSSTSRRLPRGVKKIKTEAPASDGAQDTASPRRRGRPRKDAGH